jgi:DNA-binding transcriptional LysR family regulator
LVHRHVSPTLSTNDTELEVQAVLAGQVIGQVANLAAAAHIREGRLVPILLPRRATRVPRRTTPVAGSAGP